MKLYNTLIRSLQAFEPLDGAGRTVGLYACGPTVYDEPHIGHARSAYLFDVLRRYLEFKGFRVRFVRNVTDVDDKIIEKARQEQGAGGTGQGARDLQAVCQDVAERYLKRYHEAMDRLGIGGPREEADEPRAMAYVVPQMTDFITQLVLNGVAYEAGGDVYFSVRKFPGYGKLSNRTLDELKAGARVEPGEHKQDPLDFTLWKAAKAGEPSWDSPWGPGRPGWHIECSVMSTARLGDAFDIHGGGVDLVFPHHENEIAQAQALGKPFARYWVHNGLLTVGGEKMSKSLGNFVTVDEVLQACHGEPDLVKMFFLSAHYRHPIDYTPANLHAATQRFDALDSFRVRMMAEQIEVSTPQRPLAQELVDLEQAFETAMDDDLHTPKALAVLDQLVNCGNQWARALSTSQPLRTSDMAPWDADRIKTGQAMQTLSKLGRVLGLFNEDAVGLTPEQAGLLQEREEARKRKEFHRADDIRRTFHEMGLVVEDTVRGPLVRRKR